MKRKFHMDETIIFKNNYLTYFNHISFFKKAAGRKFVVIASFLSKANIEKLVIRGEVDETFLAVNNKKRKAEPMFFSAIYFKKIACKYKNLIPFPG